MRPGDFLSAIPDRVRPLLPPEMASFEWQHRGGLMKLWHRWPRLHYEVWFHRRIDRLEVGLHFEADPTTNTRLLDWMTENLIVAKAEISERIEAEAWDHGWARVYEMLPLEPLDESYLSIVVDRLARLIVTLQPLLEQELSDGDPPAEPVAAEESRPGGRWRRRRRG